MTPLGLAEMYPSTSGNNYMFHSNAQHGEVQRYVQQILYRVSVKKKHVTQKHDQRTLIHFANWIRLHFVAVGSGALRICSENASPTGSAMFARLGLDFPTHVH